MKSLLFSVIFIAVTYLTQGSPLHIQKRAAFYIANETACVVDNTVYFNGDPIPTDDPCEACKCRPPGFACVLKDCEKKPGCRAVRRAGQCCPEYICGCEHNGRMYRDGDEIQDNKNPCYTCHCQGSSIACAFVDCFFRVDCAPEYVQGECCPHYNHCSALDMSNVSSFDDIITNPVTFETTLKNKESDEGNYSSESPNEETFADEDKIQSLETTSQQPKISEVDYSPLITAATDEDIAKQSSDTETTDSPDADLLSDKSTELNVNNKIENIKEEEDLFKTGLEEDLVNSEDDELNKTTKIVTESDLYTTSGAKDIDTELFSTAQAISEETVTVGTSDSPKIQTSTVNSRVVPLVNENSQEESLVKRFRSLENQTENREDPSENKSSTDIPSTDIPKSSQPLEPSELPEDKIAEYLRSLRKPSTSPTSQSSVTDESDLKEETTISLNNHPNAESVTPLIENTSQSEETSTNGATSIMEEFKSESPSEINKEQELVFKDVSEAIDVPENKEADNGSHQFNEEESTTGKFDASTSLQTSKTGEIEHTLSTVVDLSIDGSTTVADLSTDGSKTVASVTE